MNIATATNDCHKAMPMLNRVHELARRTCARVEYGHAATRHAIEGANEIRRACEMLVAELSGEAPGDWYKGECETCGFVFAPGCEPNLCSRCALPLRARFIVDEDEGQTLEQCAKWGTIWSEHNPQGYRDHGGHLLLHVGDLLIPHESYLEQRDNADAERDAALDALVEKLKGWGIVDARVYEVPDSEALRWTVLGLGEQEFEPAGDANDEVVLYVPPVGALFPEGRWVRVQALADVQRVLDTQHKLRTDPDIMALAV